MAALNGKYQSFRLSQLKLTKTGGFVRFDLFTTRVCGGKIMLRLIAKV
jgi:hypothetical protein